MNVATFFRKRSRLAFGWAVAGALAASGISARGDDARPSSMPLSASSESAIARAIEESWPARPEWLDMLADILQGSQLGPNDGWFRRAVVQSRFDWATTRKRLDRDGDGRIARGEFSGPDGDFARLDRDGDRVLTEADFDFTPHALTPSPGTILFARADRDGNGKVTREEFDAFFHQADGGAQGFLSLSDLQEAFRPPPRPATAPAPTGPSKETLVRALFRQELGSLQPGPSLGEPAPDFTLKTQDGKGEITLSKRVGPKPVVLVFGNFTCGPFRNQAGNIEKLARRYKDRASFLMVYVREAHPTDGWHMDSNDRVGVTIPQPRTYPERVSVAQACSARLGLGFPMLVDTIDDAVGARYSGMPSRLYLIDRDGKVAFKNGRGPFGFKPAELEHALILLLDEDARGRTPAAAAVAQ
jgi:thiol-disulfide isomerase/thioredoxin